jgi:hypothetical protein
MRKQIFGLLFSVVLTLGSFQYAGATEAPRAMRTFHDGSFDVIVLSQSAYNKLSAKIRSKLVERYGSDRFEMTVNEKSGIQYAFAYPIVLDSDRHVDAKTIATRQALTEVYVATDSCYEAWVNFYEDWFGFGRGIGFLDCDGGGVGSMNLAVYNFDNITSSHYMTNLVNFCDLWDGANETNYLGYSNNINQAYGSEWNDKLTSFHCGF